MLKIIDDSEKSTVSSTHLSRWFKTRVAVFARTEARYYDRKVQRGRGRKGESIGGGRRWFGGLWRSGRRWEVGDLEGSIQAIRWSRGCEGWSDLKRRRRRVDGGRWRRLEMSEAAAIGLGSGENVDRRSRERARVFWSFFIF